MTVSEQFIPAEEGQESGGNTIFGITPGPKLYGILGIVAGVGLAAYIGMNMLKPALDQQQVLKAEIQDKQAKIAQQKESVQKIKEAEAQLAEAKEQYLDVLSLFASESSLETLMLDANKLIARRNVGIRDEDRKLKLTKFEPKPDESGVVNDGLLGSAVNGQLQRKVYDVEVEGSFTPTQLFIRDLEQLQPLLLLKDLKSDIDQTAQKIVVDSMGKITATQPSSKLKTFFKLEALVPLSQEELAAQKAAEAAAAQPPAQ